MSDRPVRLSKAAREVNLGVSSVVEFLASKGFEVETNPNTKLTPEMYNLLLDEFQADRKMRKESEAKSEETPEVMETIAIPTKEKAVKPVPEPTPAPPAEPVTPHVAETPAAPKAGETPAAETPAEPAEEPRGPGLKVIDKIDLDGPKKKRAAEAAAKKEAEAKAAEDKVTKDKADAEAKATADAKAAADAAEAKNAADAKAKADAEPETIKAEATKLKGTTVLGKIELPVDTTRRKRKRIVKPKVDVDKVGSQNKGKRKPGGKVEASEAEIQKEIKETLARLSGKGKNKGAKLRRAKRDMVAERTAEEQERMREQSSVLKLTEFVTVSELASMMDVSATEIISACMQLGIFASINQRLDAETITLITEEFDYTVEFVSADIQESIVVEEDKEEDLQDRPPIITVMGHVDHGKTSLLDYVRSANVIAGEAGGITQHIGAYKVTLENGKEVTFLDTPGHEAFTAMRARGAQVTDLAIIVVAADDSVMPQTREAINHAQAAGVPMIFAFNKIDKEGANPDKIRDELSQMNILVEDWGGTFQSQEISAKKGTGIDELMEKVLLEAELLELKANPDKNANGTVIESELDKGRGYVSTFLVEGGTLRVGDTLVAGQHYGKIKAMFNERGKPVEEAGPASPVSVLGMNGAPSAGDNFNVLDDEKEAKNIANKRMQLQREQGVRTQRNLTLGDIGKRIAQGEYNELNIVLKGDVDGSIEALTDSLQKLSTDKVEVKIIHKGVGQISESDISLASASEAIVIGFQVRPSPAARRLAEQDEVEIKLYSVIYAAIEEVKEAMEGMLSAKIEEKVVGNIEVRETFKISKVGTIAGCFVTDGKVSRNSNIRLIRDGIVIYTGGLSALKRFKDDVKEVTKGYECGLSINGMNNIEVGDVIEVFEEVEVKQTLADS